MMLFRSVCIIFSLFCITSTFATENSAENDDLSNPSSESFSPSILEKFR